MSKRDILFSFPGVEDVALKKFGSLVKMMYGGGTSTAGMTSSIESAEGSVRRNRRDGSGRGIGRKGGLRRNRNMKSCPIGGPGYGRGGGRGQGKNLKD